MLYQEFIDRTGLSMTAEQYAEVEKMYEEASQHIDKDVFCKEYLEHRDSVLLNDFYQQTVSLKKQRLTFFEQTSELVNLLLEKAQLTDDEDMHRKAIELIGHKEVIRRKIKLNLALWEADTQYISEHLK